MNKELIHCDRLYQIDDILQYCEYLRQLDDEQKKSPLSWQAFLDFRERHNQHELQNENEGRVIDE